MHYATPEEKTNTEILLELYRQACADFRGSVTLRLQRFAVFIALTAVAGAATFSIAGLHPYHAAAGAFGLLMTILFWLLDYHSELSSQLIRKRIKACEKLLGVVEHFIPDTDPHTEFSIAVIIHLIFATILACWLAIEILILTS